MLVTPSTLPRYDSPRGFIVFEGLNGAGKSTLITKLAEHLAGRGVPLITTFEPGGTGLGIQLRSALLKRHHHSVSALSELLLFAADRAQHIAEVIEPALQQQKLVLCDRFIYSTTSFQGYGRGIDLKTVAEVNRLTIRDLVPDLVVLLDLEPSVGLLRARHRVSAESGHKSGEDHFESEKRDFHERLRIGFLEQARSLPEPFFVTDASRPPEHVFQEVLPMVMKLVEALERKHSG